MLYEGCFFGRCRSINQILTTKNLHYELLVELFDQEFC